MATKGAEKVRVQCHRCDGTGHYHGYGVCFACYGVGYKLVTKAALAARKTRARKAHADFLAKRFAGREHFTVQDYLDQNDRIVAEGRAVACDDRAETVAWAEMMFAEKERYFAGKGE